MRQQRRSEPGSICRVAGTLFWERCGWCMWWWCRGVEMIVLCMWWWWMGRWGGRTTRQEDKAYQSSAISSEMASHVRSILLRSQRMRNRAVSAKKEPWKGTPTAMRRLMRGSPLCWVLGVWVVGCVGVEWVLGGGVWGWGKGAGVWVWVVRGVCTDRQTGPAHHSSTPIPTPQPQTTTTPGKETTRSNPPTKIPLSLIPDHGLGGDEPPHAVADDDGVLQILGRQQLGQLLSWLLFLCGWLVSV